MDTQLDGEPSFSLAIVENMPASGDKDQIDWNSLQIEERLDEEGRLEVIDEDQIFKLLGLRMVDDDVPMGTDDIVNDGQERQNHIDASGNDADIDPEIPVYDDVPEERVFVHDPNKPCMDVGTVYPDMKEFRLAVRQFAINEEFELKIAKSDRTRYSGFCKGDGCPWHIVGRRQPDGKTVMVSVLVAEHACTSSARRSTITPTSAWVASKAIDIMQKKPNMKTVELRNKLQEDFNCEIHYDTVWKGRQKALKELHGSWDESFQMLFNWKEEVMKRSPGSIIEIDVKEVEGKVYFHRFFCAPKPCIEGFIEGCRPYLSIDSSALNGRWNGHIAAATAIDGHNWMYPVAFGFIDGETNDNWAWFMRQLKNVVAEVPNLAVCTDACKGLENAIKEAFPQAEHRECFRHLMNNFVKRFGGDIFSKMYPAARAYRKEVFQYFFQQVIDGSPDAKTWLERNHKLKWMRSEFNIEIKCDYITNNLAECFNNWIKDYKDLPVHELADKIRQMTMVLWNKRRLIGERLHGRILPAVIHQLKAKTRGLGHLTVVKANTYAAEIWDSTTTRNRHVVKSYLHECTCLEWQHTGKPCQHALALVTAQQVVDVNLEDFVHEYYSIDRFRKAYSRLIEPLPDRTQWPKVNLPFVVAAPLDKRLVGRQRQLRIKGCLEGGSGGKTKKSAKESAAELDKGKKQMIRGKRKCKRCGELGHGETSYKCTLNGTKKRPRKPRKNTTKYGPQAKVPTKIGQNEVGVEAENVEESGVVVAENVEESGVVVAATRELLFGDSPNRVTIR
uniref:Mutator-like transposase n=1 Tax=Zea mays TaxID=4577 RepID=S5MQP1_MAIZE|nr:mutator-like transposase [Zea mays]